MLIEKLKAQWKALIYHAIYSRHANYLSKNPIQHSHTKHIEVRHHFICDHVEKSNITLSFIPTENQLVDIYTKPISPDHFAYIRMELGMLNDIHELRRSKGTIITKY